jgi:glycosyltransferase involved in cell wall biosynthesis
MRVAIVHYWLLNMRGGEKVVESLCRLFPDADLFTLFYDPDRVSACIRRHRVQTSFLQPLRKYYRALLPFMPMALENFDLRDYDLVISSESGPAKGVLVRSDARHICYCHTPMRYLWELHSEYRKEWTASRLKRALMTPLSHYLRLWDYASAARVDDFIANSENTRQRIHRSYRRDATVIYPPVDVDSFYSKPAEDYYLIVSELVSYKRLDAAIRVFAHSGRRLRVVGEGPEFKALHRLAGKNIEFCGRVSDEELRELYARCLALVVPGEEDFGIVAVEALASGKPVVALGKGGVPEIVPRYNPLGGVLYSTISDAALLKALEDLESAYHLIRPPALQNWAMRFSEAEFTRRISALLSHPRMARILDLLEFPTGCSQPVQWR